MYTSSNNQSQIYYIFNSNSTEFCLVNHALIYEISDLNVSKNINVEGEISIKIPNGLYGVNVCKILESR